MRAFIAAALVAVATAGGIGSIIAGTGGIGLGLGKAAIGVGGLGIGGLGVGGLGVGGLGLGLGKAAIGVGGLGVGGLGVGLGVRKAVGVGKAVAVGVAEARPYQYKYAVDDPNYGPMANKEEVSDGLGNVVGSYAVNLPDGRTQIVKYAADGINGYNAEVSYVGVAQHPQVAQGVGVGLVKKVVAQPVLATGGLGLLGKGIGIGAGTGLGLLGKGIGIGGIGTGLVGKGIGIGGIGTGLLGKGIGIGGIGTGLLGKGIGIGGIGAGLGYGR